METTNTRRYFGTVRSLDTAVSRLLYPPTFELKDTGTCIAARVSLYAIDTGFI
jgi:hypothetical protein